jgi:ribonuclease D
MILPAKLIGPILKSIESGKQGLLDNRTIPDKLITTHWEMFQRLFQGKATDEEIETIAKIPQPISDDPRRDVSMELLHVLVKYKCLESGVAPSLVLNKSDLTYALPGEDIFEDKTSNWQKEFLGTNLLNWLHKRKLLHIEIDASSVIVNMEE